MSSSGHREYSVEENIQFSGIPENANNESNSEENHQPEPTDRDPHNPGTANDDKLGHMCIVLSPAVRRQLLRGEPLIVGTSTASVESFFQRLISVCQLGAHMPVMFQTLGGAVTVANIKKKKAGIVPRQTVDRYPIPRAGIPTPKRARPEVHQAHDNASVASTSGGTNEQHNRPMQEEERELDKKKMKYDRDEIPIEAIRQYLTDHRYFPGWSANAKRNLRKRCKDFIIDSEGILRYTGRKGAILPCIEDRAQRMSLIWEAHIVDHRRRDGLLGTLRQKYYWKGMFQDVNKVLDSCKVCALAKDLKDRDRETYEDAGSHSIANEHPSEDEAPPVPTPKKSSHTKTIPPALPEPELAEKYPETSEVPIAGQSSGME